MNIVSQNKIIEDYLLEKEEEQIKPLLVKLEKYKWIYRNIPGEQDIAQRYIKTIEKKIEKVKSVLIEYRNKISPIIEEYKYFLKNSTFGSNRKDLLLKFQEIAKDYYPILLDIKRNPLICECGGGLEYNDEVGYICKICYSVIPFMEDIQTSPNFKARRKNFEKVLQEFQGKIKIDIPDNVIMDIKKFLSKYNINNPTIKDIKDIIAKLKLSAYNKQVYLIYSIITGESPIDISEIEDRILERYDIFMGYYTKTFKNNSIKGNYLLYHFLQMEGIKLPEDIFFMPKTLETRTKLDNIMKEICKVLEKEYPKMNWKI